MTDTTANKEKVQCEKCGANISSEEKYELEGLCEQCAWEKAQDDSFERSL